MVISSIWLSSDAAYACLAHSLSTDKQEVMGLLLGHYDGESHAVIRRIIVVTRKDKQKDRVEVGYENLAIASSMAEELSELDGEPVNVIGWYHSHPHITVFPSHVDCRTQGLYQTLDSMFIGLIFSVYDESSGKLEICGFQSRNTGTEEAPHWKRVEVPVEVYSSSSKLSALSSALTSTKYSENLLEMLVVMLNEEKAAFEDSFKHRVNGQETEFMEISRKSYIYQSCLHRVVDRQIAPLKACIQSRIASLELERKELKAKLAKRRAAETVAVDAPGTGIVSSEDIDLVLTPLSPDSSPSHVDSTTDIKSTHHFEDSLKVFSKISPNWHMTQRLRALGHKGLWGTITVVKGDDASSSSSPIFTFPSNSVYIRFTQTLMFSSIGCLYSLLISPSSSTPATDEWGVQSISCSDDNQCSLSCVLARNTCASITSVPISLQFDEIRNSNENSLPLSEIVLFCQHFSEISRLDLFNSK